MIKKFKTKDAARKNLAEGIHTVCRLLTGTFGPTGSNVIMEDENGNLLLSAQPYSVLRNLKSPDLFVDEGIQMAREAALNTERLVGSGSVMTLLFMEEMVRLGQQMIAGGANPVMLARGLKKELPLVEQKIQKLSRLVDRETLLRLLNHELEEEDLAELVLEAYEQVGAKGVILVKEGHGLTTELEQTRGFEIQGSYLAGSIKTMYQPYILIVNQVVDQFSKLLPILEQLVAAKAGMILIAEDVRGEALTMLTQNIQKQIFDVVVIKAPGIGRRRTDLLEDLAIVTGGCVLDDGMEYTLEDMKLEDLGRAEEIRVEKNRMLCLNGRGKSEEIEKRIQKIKEYLDANETEFMDKNQYLERVGNLEGNIALIRAGAPTLVESHEKTHRIQSALAAVRAADRGGVLPEEGEVLKSITNRRWNEGKEWSYNNGEELGKRLILEAVRSLEGTTCISLAADVILTALEQAASVIYEWLSAEVLMVSVTPDREDVELMKKGIPVMR